MYLKTTIRFIPVNLLLDPLCPPLFLHHLHRSPSIPLDPSIDSTLSFECSNECGKNIFVYFADEEPPSYGNPCPQDIKTYTENDDDVHVIWRAPNFTDNSGGPITVKITGQSGSSKYPVGTTLITYSATDTAGLTTKCSFSVKVISKYAL